MPEDKITDSRIPLLLLSCSRRRWRLPTTKVTSTVFLVVFKIFKSLLIFLAHLKFDSGRSSVSEKGREAGLDKTGSSFQFYSLMSDILKN